MIVNLNDCGDLSETAKTHQLAQEYSDLTAERTNLHKEIRSYEISLWTLQDEFITVLKWSDTAQKGRIEDPEMKLDVDGTAELKFKIPMYIRIFKEKDRNNNKPNDFSRMTRVENPIWYNTQNGNLIESMRKLKVIFNKGEQDEGVFEFIIIKVTETHEEDQLYCEVESEGLAFNELGKIGYKCYLSEEEYNLYIENLQKDNPESTLSEIIAEYPSNINYWMSECANIEEWPKTQVDGDYDDMFIPDPRKWYYKIDMDWTSFANGKNRKRNVIYEESYTSSWEIQENPSDGKNYVVPVKEEDYKEKCRIVETSDSNIYNITQTIAEKFGVFCRYEYGHDENYHITSRCIIFYNNFMKEHDILTINYPHKAKKISRSMDGTDLTTKLFVRPIEDESTRRGSINIINTDANKMHEDYLLDFEYMRTCKGINEEQYKAIDEYEQNMAILNDAIIPLQNQFSTLSMKLPELEAEVAVLEESLVLDDESIEKYKAFEQALYAKYGNGTDAIVIDERNPQICMLSELSTNINDDGSGLSTNNIQAFPIDLFTKTIELEKQELSALYNTNNLITNEVKLSDDYKGIIESTIIPYSAWDSRTSVCSFPYEDFKVEHDPETGFPTRLYNLKRFKGNSQSVVVNGNSVYGYDIFGTETTTTYEYAWSNSSSENPSTWISGADIEANSNAISPAVTFQTAAISSKGGINPHLIPIGNLLSEKPVPQATLTADEKKANRYLWQKVNHNYEKDYTIADYFVYDFGDPDSSSFYSSWTHLFYCLSYDATGEMPTVARPTNAVLDGARTDVNQWTTCFPYYYEDSSTTKHKYYVCWQKAKQSYVKSNDRWGKINPANLVNNIPVGNATIDGTESNHATYIHDNMSHEYYTHELTDSTYEFTTPARDTNYGTFQVAAGKVYLTFSYKPQLYYQELIRIWTNKRKKDQQELATKRAELGEDNGDAENSTGLYKTLYMINDTVNMYIEEKENLIQDFEHMMGPALREGYWDAEDYTNYGDPKEVIFTSIDGDLTEDTNTNAIIGWDEEYFDSEEKSYYEYSIEQTHVNYPCINLLEVFKRNDGNTYTIDEQIAYALSCIKRLADKLQELSNTNEDDPNFEKNMGSRLQFVYSSTQLVPALGFNNNNKRLARYAKTMVVGSTALLRFMKSNDGITPVLVLVGAETLPDGEVTYMKTRVNNGVRQAYPELGISYINDTNPANSYDADNIFVESYENYNYVIPSNAWVDGNYTLVYPHIKISSLDLKTEDTQVFFTYAEDNAKKTMQLEEYTHYSVLSRINAYPDNQSKVASIKLYSGRVIETSNDITGGVYESANYIAIKPEVFYRYGAMPGYNQGSIIINYYISNASTALYLDAREVLDENSVPKVEYEVETNILRNDFVRTLYSRLAQIMMINDVELKFDNVFGYISAIELKLDKPDEDTIEVKNYKTKFEDLFSTIVAQTDSMKKNSGILESLANGTLINTQTIMSTIEDSEELEKTLDNYMADTNVTTMLTELWTEAGNILATTQNTLDAAHALNIKNANILGGFAERVQDALMPTITRGVDPPSSFKAGDIFIEVDEYGNEVGRYVGMMNSDICGSMTRTYDGNLTTITGASLSVNADTGDISILAQNKIDIKSGNSIYIAANENVDIIGNKAVNIGGSRINIAALGNCVTNSGITLIADVDVNEHVPANSYRDTDEETYILAHLMDLIEPYKDTTTTPVYEKVAFRTRIAAAYVYKDERPQLSLGNDTYTSIGIVNDDLNKWGAEIPVTNDYDGYQKIYEYIEGALSQLSRVCIYPQRIELDSANIYMKGSNRILAVASLGSGNASVVDISASGGIFIGSGNSITFYSGSVVYNDETKTYSNSSGSSVEINKDHILLGVSTQSSGTAMELSQKQIILAAGATNVSNISSSTTSTITTNASYSGIQIQQNYIGMASGTGNERSLISIKPGQILIGTANGITESSFTNGVPGSGIKIATSGITIGSNAHLSIATGNVVINSNGGNGELFRIGTVDSNNALTNGIQYKNGTLTVRGNIYAGNGTFTGTINATTLHVGNGTDLLTYDAGKLTMSTNFYYDGSTLRIGQANGNNMTYTSSGLNVTGSITAISGDIGNWQIASTGLTKTLTSTSEYTLNGDLIKISNPTYTFALTPQAYISNESDVINMSVSGAAQGGIGTFQVVANQTWSPTSTDAETSTISFDGAPSANTTFNLFRVTNRGACYAYSLDVTDRIDVGHKIQFKSSGHGHGSNKPGRIVWNDNGKYGVLYIDSNGRLKYSYNGSTHYVAYASS